MSRMLHLLRRAGLAAPKASWDQVRSGKETRLYAGTLNPARPQYRTHLGLALSAPDSRNILHDIRKPMPIADRSIDIYQAEDVFEHIEYDEIPSIFDEIHRVLKPGGLFRFSVPDYRCDVLAARTWRDKAGTPLFDPDGGGQFVNGKVIGGGHVWFPVFETVSALFDQSCFRAEYLHYTAPDGALVMLPIDYLRGFIARTPDHDDRVQSPRRPMSIVVDARVDS